MTMIKSFKKSERNKKGFTLAEMLISLLVLSIILAASIQTVTSHGRNKNANPVWKWSKSNNSIYAAGDTSIIAGFGYVPSISTEAVFGDEDDDIIVGTADDEILLRHEPQGDKLVLFTRDINIGGGRHLSLANSALTFYTESDNAISTKDDYKYVGRLAADMYNIALGKGSLQSIESSDIKGNMAIGHYALFRNSYALDNTAIGSKSLSSVRGGNENTALGYKSLYKLSDNVSGGETKYSVNNTVMGANIAEDMLFGSDNIFLGASSFPDMIFGDNNFSAGYNTCKNIVNGSNNICIGHKSGRSISSESKDFSHGLFIGSSSQTGSADLITGFTDFDLTADKPYDKSIFFNSGKFMINTFDSKKTMYMFSVKKGASGYDSEGEVNADSLLTMYSDGNSNDTYSETYADADKIKTIFKNVSAAMLTPAHPYNGYIEFNDGALGLNFNPRINENEYDVIFSTINNLNIIDTVLKVKSQNMINTMSVTDNSSASDPYYSFDLSVSSDSNSDIAEVLNFNKGLKISVTEPSSDEDLKQYFNFKSYSDSSSEFGIDLNEFSLNLGDNSSGILFKFDDINNSLELKNGSANKDIILNASEGKGSFGVDVAVTSMHIAGNGSSVKETVRSLAQKIGSASSSPSDKRLKKHIRNNRTGLNVINKLRVINFVYKNDKKKQPHTGVIAQELQKIFPNSVFKGEDGYLRIKTNEIFWACVNSVKELFVQIQHVAAKITGLEKRLIELETENQRLRTKRKELEKRLRVVESKINR